MSYLRKDDVGVLWMKKLKILHLKDERLHPYDEVLIGQMNFEDSAHDMERVC
jgi:hypothetical protein